MDDTLLISENQGFASTLNRPAFFIGEEKKREELSSEIKALSFIHQPPMQSLYTSASRPFIIAICDFEQELNLKTIVRSMKRLASIDAIKILYVLGSTSIDLEHTIFSQQIGCHQLCFGEERSSQLRAYLKSIAFSKIDETVFNRLNKQIAQAISKREFDRLKKMSASLIESTKTEVYGLKLLAKINSALKEESKVVFYLRQILKIDRQNIWAANALAKVFLEGSQIKKGIEILEAETDFCLPKDRSIDPTSGPLRYLSSQPIAGDMLSFLNLRAVMAIRTNELEAGMGFYKLALAGSQSQPSVQSKLYFNLGIACMKINDFQSAVTYLETSFKLGNEEDQMKVRQPLEKAQKALQFQKEKPAVTMAPSSAKDLKIGIKTENSEDELDLTD